MIERNTKQTPGRQVWFITEAARSMGVDIAKAALAAGHVVVGTARAAAKVTAAIGQQENPLAVW